MNDKTYENAMLRTLGWKKSHISLLAVIKITVYYSFPGAISALLLIYYTCANITTVLSEINNRPILFEFDILAVIVGLGIAFLLPLLSLIGPLSQ